MSDLSLREPDVRTPGPARRTTRDRTRLLRGVLVRLGTALLVLLCTATVSFFLVRLSGDPVKQLLPPDATAHQETVLRASLGLDRPLLTQYLDFLGGCPASTSGTPSSTTNRSGPSWPTGCRPPSNSRAPHWW